MRKPKRDLLRSRFKLCRTCSLWLGELPRQIAGSREFWWLEREEREKKQRTRKQNNPELESTSLTLMVYSHPAVSHSTGHLSPVCPARPSKGPLCQVLVTEPPRHCQSKRACMGFTHKHLWLQVSPFYQPEKQLSDPALQDNLHFQGISSVSGKDGLQDTAFSLSSHQK